MTTPERVPTEPSEEAIAVAERLFDDAVEKSLIQEVEDSNPTPFVDAIALALDRGVREERERVIHCALEILRNEGWLGQSYKRISVLLETPND